MPNYRKSVCNKPICFTSLSNARCHEAATSNHLHVPHYTVSTPYDIQDTDRYILYFRVQLLCGNVHDRALKNKVLSKAKRRVILMDSTKIGQTMPHTFANCDEIDAIVTDDELSDEMREYFWSKNIEIL